MSKEKTSQKLTKLQSKFSLILGQLNWTLNNQAQVSKWVMANLMPRDNLAMSQHLIQGWIRNTTNHLEIRDKHQPDGHFGSYMYADFFPLQKCVKKKHKRTHAFLQVQM